MQWMRTQAKFLRIYHWVAESVDLRFHADRCTSGQARLSPRKFNLARPSRARQVLSPSASTGSKWERGGSVASGVGDGWRIGIRTIGPPPEILPFGAGPFCMTSGSPSVVN